MFVLLTLLTLEGVSSRLVLESWSDLYRDDGSVDTDRIVREASLVSVTTEPYPKCPDVQLEVHEYEFFLVKDGVETRYTIAAKNIVDIFNTTRTMKNNEDPWIKAPVMIR